MIKWVRLISTADNEVFVNGDQIVAIDKAGSELGDPVCSIVMMAGFNGLGLPILGSPESIRRDIDRQMSKGSIAPISMPTP